LKSAANDPVGSQTPNAMIATVISVSGKDARLWRNAIFGVRIMWTINVCVNRPTTNQPDWNNVCVAIELAWKTHHITANVMMSKTELTGPKHSMKRPMSAGFHFSGFATRSASTLSNGMPTWPTS